MKIKNRKPNDKELGQLLALQRKILREAQKRGVEMSKAKAKKLAAAALGFVDQKDYAKLQQETHNEKIFADGMKSALPKYRNL